MSELNNQITVTSIYELGAGNLITVRKHLAELLEKMEAGVSAFKIDKVRLVSYGLADGTRQTVIPGDGLLTPESNGHSGFNSYHLQDNDVTLFLKYQNSTQSIKVSRTDSVSDVELAITIIEQDFKPSGDGYLHIAIPVRADFADGQLSYRALTIDRGSFKEDGELIKGTWGMEHGSFEPAFDAKGNIIAFNLVNKPQ